MFWKLQEFHWKNKNKELFIRFAIIQELCKALNEVDQETININNFLDKIYGIVNKRRQALIDKAFLKFDEDGAGIIKIKDLKGVYNTAIHPKVQKGEMSENDAYDEFIQYFANAEKEGIIAREEWNQYFQSVSSQIMNDDHFVELMKIVWKLK